MFGLINYKQEIIKILSINFYLIYNEHLFFFFNDNYLNY